MMANSVRAVLIQSLGPFNVPACGGSTVPRKRIARREVAIVPGRPGPKAC